LKSQSRHGGRRPGAGKPKGHQAQGTLDKIAARELVRIRVTAALGPLVDAQIANATGLKYLVTRDKKSGKFVRVTEAMARLAKRQEIIEVWEKDPSTPAFAYLLDRALDRTAEQEIPIRVRGSAEADARVARLVAARLRVAKK
jgi:hypothetical protein